MESNNFRITHRSTAPATKDKEVKLFVREYDGTRPSHSRKCVLMIHGRSVPSLPTFDLEHNNYSWAQSLAKDGFDVFMLDLQGCGLSPLPQMYDPCNTSKSDQQKFLIPNPLMYECDPCYKFVPITSQSEWDELNTVVDWIIENRDVRKVSIIGYSAGAFAVGPYAIQNEPKVESVFLAAPVFPPNGLTNAPATLPVGGVPMQVTTKSLFKDGWDKEIPSNCPNQREEGMVDIVWKALMDIDTIGKTWGGQNPNLTEGVLRFRTFTHWAWTTEAVSQGTLGKSIPVCIIYGENDKAVMQDTGVPATTFNVEKLYKAIPGNRKLMFKVACAGHQMVWEKNAKLLHNYSKQWLKTGEVEGREKGNFYRNKDGIISDVRESEVIEPVI